MSILDVIFFVNFDSEAFEISESTSISGKLSGYVEGPAPLETNVVFKIQLIGTMSRTTSDWRLKSTIFDMSAEIIPAIQFPSIDPNKFEIPFVFQLPSSNKLLPSMKSKFLAVKYTFNFEVFPNISSKTRKRKIKSTEVVLIQSEKLQTNLISQNTHAIVTNKRKYFRKPSFFQSLTSDYLAKASYEVSLPGGLTYFEGTVLSGSLSQNGALFRSKRKCVDVSLVTYLKYLQPPDHFSKEYQDGLALCFISYIERGSEIIIYDSKAKKEVSNTNFKITVPDIPSIDSDLLKTYSFLQISILNHWNSSRKLIIEAPIVILKKRNAVYSHQTIGRTALSYKFHPNRIFPHPRFCTPVLVWPSPGLESLLPVSKIESTVHKDQPSPMTSLLVISSDISASVQKVINPKLEVTNQQVMTKDISVSVVTEKTVAAHIVLLIKLEKLHTIAGFNFKSDSNVYRSNIDLLFYCNAETRYIQWIEYLSKNSDTLLFPPLDVAMFWTAHMLNCTAYASDTNQCFWKLEQFSFPLIGLSNLWAKDNCQAEKIFWRHSGIPDDDDSEYYLKPGTISSINYKCLWCKTSAKYPNDYYLSYRFRSGNLKCASCHQEFNLEQSGVKIFLDDLVEIKNGNRLLPQWHHILTLCHDFPESTKALIDLRKSSNSLDWKAVVNIIKTHDQHAYTRVHHQKKTDFVPILKSYQNRHFRFASIDLFAAVCRQRSFIRHIASGSVEISQKSIQNAIVRYHRFLRLMRENRSVLLVPTRDIDICWHTHQLFPKEYEHYGKSLLGYFIHHDDRISKSKLDKGALQTSQLWEDAFGEPYFIEVPLSVNIQNIEVSTHVREILDFLHPFMEQKDKGKSLLLLNKDESDSGGDGGGGTNAFLAGGTSDFGGLGADYGPLRIGGTDYDSGESFEGFGDVDIGGCGGGCGGSGCGNGGCASSCGT